MTNVHVFTYSFQAEKNIHISELSDGKQHDNSSPGDIFHTFHKRIEYTRAAGLAIQFFFFISHSSFKKEIDWNQGMAYGTVHSTVKCLSRLSLVSLN